MKTYSALIASLMMATPTAASADTAATVQSCSPSNPTTTPCPLGSKCQATLLRGANAANSNGGGKCVPIHCDPTAAEGPCPDNTKCQRFLGNTNGDAQCVPVSSVCWQSMGQYGCKVNPNKSGTEADGCYATESKCTIAATSPPSVCWQSMGQYGCKVNPNKSGTEADGCYATESKCTIAATAPPLVCWQSMGQYGCKVNPNKSGSIADGCFPSQHVCEHGLQRALRANGDRALGSARPRSCNTKLPLLFSGCNIVSQECKPMLGNTKGTGTCVPKTPPQQRPCSTKTVPVMWNGCNSFTEQCKPMLGNTKGEGVCVPKTPPQPKCWQSMGQYGCKVNPNKSGSIADGCFPSQHVCEHGLQSS